MAKESHQRALDGIQQLEMRLSFRFAVLQRLMDRQMTRILSRHQLTLATYRILITIKAFNEISAANLVRLVVVDKGLVSRCCTEMQTAGLIHARQDPSNGRRKLLQLTAAGDAKLAAVEPEVDARNTSINGQLEDNERDTLDRVLAKLTTHVAASLDDHAELRLAT
ncbi:MAG: MarR family winged helix-turn-helix transcriptional regulator [Pseudomonadota bacterium]